jgi:hypothetical protein
MAGAQILSWQFVLKFGAARSVQVEVWMARLRLVLLATLRQICRHASNIDQLFGAYDIRNPMVATPTGVQSGHQFTGKVYRRRKYRCPIHGFTLNFTKP